MAQKVSNLLKAQNPNYDYLRDMFRFVRENLNIEVTTQALTVCTYRRRNQTFL